jgi:hypothetical protein
MSNNSNLEVPEALRQAVENNVDQLRTAYEQFMDMARKAQSIASETQGGASEAARRLHETTLRFTQENVDGNFRMISEIARATTFPEMFELQGRHAQEWMATYTEQAQELSRLMREVTSQPAGGGKWPR